MGTPNLSRYEVSWEVIPLLGKTSDCGVYHPHCEWGITVVLHFLPISCLSVSLKKLKICSNVTASLMCLYLSFLCQTVDIVLPILMFFCIVGFHLKEVQHPSLPILPFFLSSLSGFECSYLHVLLIKQNIFSQNS